MRTGPHIKRSRSRPHGQGNGQSGNGQSGNGNGMGNGQGNRKPMSLRHQTFDSNGPDIRVRGTAFQVLEKYLALARDATTSGDRIAAENFYQHAEHYYRIINANGEANQLVAATPRDMEEGSGVEESDAPDSMPEIAASAPPGVPGGSSSFHEPGFGSPMPRRAKPERRGPDGRGPDSHGTEAPVTIVDLSTVEQPDIHPAMMLEASRHEEREARANDPQVQIRARRSHLGFGQRLTRSPYQKGHGGFGRGAVDSADAPPGNDPRPAAAEAPMQAPLVPPISERGNDGAAPPTVVRRRPRRDLFEGGSADRGGETHRPAPDDSSE